MVQRIVALIFIFLCTAAAWAILGSTVFSRTYSADAKLGGKVASTWGAPQEQTPPVALTEKLVPRNVESVEDGKKVVRTIEDRVVSYLPLERSRIRVNLDLDHRQKGLLWYSTYRVDFSSLYTFRNTTDRDDVKFTFNFPAAQAIYDDLVFTVDGVTVPLTNEKAGASGAASVPRGQTALLQIAYRSQGLSTWAYGFGEEVAQVKDFELFMTTDFREIDFPENTLSPSQKIKTPRGWDLTWSYKNLVAGFKIAMALPEKLQPGPLAGRISYFAPVSLLFFFFIVFLITTLRGIDLHPMNYFFLAAAFFAFHLLLAYLVDHVSIHTAFLISSGVSLFLVVSYLRLAVGMRFAAVEAALAQLVYLVLFSYAFFYKGFTGLAITIGAVLTLFLVMQMTGRIRWSERFQRSGKGAGGLRAPALNGC